MTVEVSGDVAPAVGSHSLLLQMTMNLLLNAIVHNLPERGTVQVYTENRDGAVVLTVENTGERLTPKLVRDSLNRPSAAPNASAPTMQLSASG